MKNSSKPTFFSGNRFDVLQDKTNREIARLARSAEEKTARNFLNKLAAVKGAAHKKAAANLMTELETRSTGSSIDEMPVPKNTPR